MSIRLVAFDFGTTTCKAVLARAELSRNAVTGRTELRAVKSVHRPEPVLTPYLNEETPAGDDSAGVIDFERLGRLVDQWLNLEKDDSSVVAGGVIVTGLAAKSQNAKRVAESVRARLGDAVVAIADNPGQESWLAFMGSCASLSGIHPKALFINLDIGGGTTNLASGRDQSVFATGSLWIGGRHFQFDAGTFRLTRCSRFGEKILKILGIPAKPGSEWTKSHIERIVEVYVRQLEAVVGSAQKSKAFHFLWQLPFERLRSEQQPVVTFSGGVGEIVYRLSQGEEFPLTPFGDIGVELARGIVASEVLSKDLRQFVPPHQGRATVSGLAFHGVEASGATVYLKDPSLLPLRDIPFLGRISLATPSSEFNRLLERIKGLRTGAALQVVLNGEEDAEWRSMAARLSGALRKNSFAKGSPLIIFLRENLGKTFGHYASDWGRQDVDLIVVDEIDGERISQKACFTSINPSGDKNLLVSFYGGLE